jgi:hypothetical protein
MSGVDPHRLSIDFAGEWHYPTLDEPFTIGREADLIVGDNPYLHRRLATLIHETGVWWLVNTGSSTALSLSAGNGVYQAWVGPGIRVPLVFGRLIVVFTAGAFTYEVIIYVPEPAWREVVVQTSAPVDGETTMGQAELTESQRLLVLALAEPLLRELGAGPSSIPSSARAAERLGWPITTFNRKLDAVCDKLDRAGVPGLRGGPGNLAIHRKVRLVEHAVLSRLVTTNDLSLLHAVAAHAQRRVSSSTERSYSLKDGAQ